MTALPDFDDLEDKEAAFFIEPRDKDPASEFTRQRAFLAYMARHAPAVDVLAIPNAGRGTDWERVRRWNEGARAGALDLVITWNCGVFFAEMKNGQAMPTKAQRDRLSMYVRMGHRTGVYRTAAQLVEHLSEAGAPFLDLEAG